MSIKNRLDRLEDLIKPQSESKTWITVIIDGDLIWYSPTGQDKVYLTPQGYQDLREKYNTIEVVYTGIEQLGP